MASRGKNPSTVNVGEIEENQFRKCYCDLDVSLKLVLSSFLVEGHLLCKNPDLRPAEPLNSEFGEHLGRPLPYYQRTRSTPLKFSCPTWRSLSNTTLQSIGTA